MFCRLEGDAVRYGILSDIHGNHDALDSVLRGLEREDIDSYVCLGDLVGYGPEPQACVQRIRKVADSVVAGNEGSRNGGFGMRVWLPSSGNNFVENELNDNGVVGLTLQAGRAPGPVGNLFARNTIVGNGAIDVFQDGTSTPNTFRNNTCGTSFGPDVDCP